jgi:hypothetical protein
MTRRGRNDGLWREMENRAKSVSRKLARAGRRKRGTKPPVRFYETPRDPGRLPHSGERFRKGAVVAAALLSAASLSEV